jgi:phosphate transport system permease protein
MTTIAPPTLPAALLSNSAGGMRKVKDRAATTAIWLSFGIAIVPLVWLLYTVIDRGYSVVIKSGWFTESQRNITFRTPGGGATHAIVGTLEQVLVCALISVPIAVLVGIYLVEYAQGPMARLTSFMIDILTGIPSIVAALFVYAVFITTFGGERQGFYVSLALVMLMVPVIVRTTEEMLKLVPNELREASYALGVPKWKTIMRIVIPTAFSGIVTGVMLGIARVAGETAPLLVLVGYTPNTNTNLFTGFQGTLPGMMYNQVPQLGNVRFTFAADRMWGAALTLIGIVMILNILARLVASTSKVSN